MKHWFSCFPQPSPLQASIIDLMEMGLEECCPEESRIQEYQTGCHSIASGGSYADLARKELAAIANTC